MCERTRMVFLSRDPDLLAGAQPSTRISDQADSSAKRKMRGSCRGRGLTRGSAPQDGYTPLHTASYFFLLRTEVVELLLKAGADVFAEDQVRE